MIPIGDSVPIRRAPVVTRTLVLINIAVFVYELWLGPRVDGFIRAWGVSPLLISSAIGGDPRVPREVLLTLVTSQFLHAGLLHLGGNLLFLWIFGDNVEDRFGRLVYLLFYLGCGIGASLVQVATDPGSRIPLIGASGAIAGVLGAYIRLYPGAWVIVLVPLLVFVVPIPVPAVLVLGLWFVSQFLSGVAAITTTSQATGGVAFWAHVGGFVTGMALASLLPTSARAARRPGSVSGPDQLTERIPTQPPPRTTRRAVSGRSAPLVVRGVSLLSDLLLALIGARVLVVLLDLRGPGVLGRAGRTVLEWTWPLVSPFADWLPMLRLDGYRVELFSLAALLVYALLFSVLVAIFGAAVRPFRSAR